MRIGSSTGAAGSPPPLTLTNSFTDKTSALKAANETRDLFFEKRAIKFFITLGLRICLLCQSFSANAFRDQFITLFHKVFSGYPGI
jgi:hypothetical protein